MLPTIDPTTLQVTTTLDRKILTEPDLDNWKLTTTYQWIQQYLVELIEGTQQQPQEETEREPNQVIQQLVQFLSQVSDICHQYDSPPSSSSNVPHTQHHESFISFRSKLSTSITSFHSSIPSLPTAALAELQFHLTRSFGSVSRFDYGTSHELSFILYLLILRLTSTLTTFDAKDTIRVLDKYWEVSELVRKTFGLEQAGKRGVWKKQDHDGGRMWFDQGASQARGHPTRSTPSPPFPPLPISLIPLVFLSSIATLLIPNPLTSPRTPSPPADGLSREQELELEALQDERVGNEGTVASWHVPVLSGQEDLMSLREGGAGMRIERKASDRVEPIESRSRERER
ncbi:hypothetical protein JCM5353_006937 [Sporobolomyces roseus]